MPSRPRYSCDVPTREIQTHTLQWDKTWQVELYIDVGGPTARCVGFKIASFRTRANDEPVPMPKGLVELTATRLREVPLGRFVTTAINRHTAFWRNVKPVDPETGEEMPTSAAFNRAINAALEPYEQAARRYGADHMREVARVYSGHLADGQPTKAVAEHFKISRSAAAKQVARCRQLGLLGATQKGRAGGRLRTTTRGGKR